VQYTVKDVSISSGGDPAGFDPAFDSTQGAVFNNGWWDFSDPSVRDNDTIGANITQSLSTANWGSHTLEYGAQYVESTTGGENKQSATGYNFYSSSFNIDPVSAGGAPFWDHTNNPGLTPCTLAGGKSAACSFDTFNIVNYYSATAPGLQFPYRLVALSLGGDQKIKDLGLYVNDTWEVGKWRFDIGLRWDDYQGTGPLAYQDFDFNEIAPRVGVTYNVDQNWQVQAFYGKYVSRFNDNVFNGATGVSNAPGVYTVYNGDDCWADPASNAGNTLSNGDPIDPDGDGCDAYDIRALLRDEGSWGGILLSNNPDFPSTFMANNVDSPYADDYNFSVKRALPRNTGTLDFSYIHREFHDLLDTFQGAVCDDFNYTYTNPITKQSGFCENASVVDTVGTLTDTRIWGNTAVAQRSYDGFVLLGTWRPSAKWGVGGNYTYGEISGNYEGEGRNTPSSGSLIGNYERGYSAELAYPTGILDEEIQNRVRLWGDYRFDFDRAGALVLGSVLGYQSGQVYSHTATTARSSAPNCSVTGGDPNVSPGCYLSQGSTFVGTYDSPGNFNFNSWWAWDVSARYQFPIWKELGGWVKADVINVLNNDELIRYQVTGSAPSNGSFNNWQPSGNIGTPACPTGAPSETCSGFGRIRNQFDYQVPRSYVLTVGIQF
jgi:hypothetical protein